MNDYNQLTEPENEMNLSYDQWVVKGYQAMARIAFNKGYIKLASSYYRDARKIMNIEQENT